MNNNIIVLLWHSNLTKNVISFSGL